MEHPISVTTVGKLGWIIKSPTSPLVAVIVWPEQEKSQRPNGSKSVVGLSQKQTLRCWMETKDQSLFIDSHHLPLNAVDTNPHGASSQRGTGLRSLQNGFGLGRIWRARGDVFVFAFHFVCKFCVFFPCGDTLPKKCYPRRRWNFVPVLEH